MNMVLPHNPQPRRGISGALKVAIMASFLAPALIACTHTVKIDPSDKPIIININLNIQQEIRVRLEKDIEDMLANNPDVF